MKKTFISLTLILLISMLYGQESSSWTPEFQMKFKTIQQTSISQDGKYVAYVVREPVMEGEKSEYLSQIWVAATDGSFNEQYKK